MIRGTDSRMEYLIDLIRDRHYYKDYCSTVDQLKTQNLEFYDKILELQDENKKLKEENEILAELTKKEMVYTD